MLDSGFFAQWINSFNLLHTCRRQTNVYFLYTLYTPEQSEVLYPEFNVSQRKESIYKTPQSFKAQYKYYFKVIHSLGFGFNQILTPF